MKEEAVFSCLFSAGTLNGQTADHRKCSSTAGGPARAPQKRRAEAANPPQTGARGADVTQNWTSLSMTRSTPREERRAMNWIQKNWRGEKQSSTLSVSCSHTVWIREENVIRQKTPDGDCSRMLSSPRDLTYIL